MEIDIYIIYLPTDTPEETIYSHIVQFHFVVFRLACFEVSKTMLSNTLLGDSIGKHYQNQVLILIK